MADAEERVHESGAPLPVADLSALLLHRFCRRALAGCQGAGVRLRARLHRVPVLLRLDPVGGVFTSFGIARDFEYGFARRLLLAAPNRTGIVLGYALAASIRWAFTAAVLTAVALLAGMNIFGGPVDMFGMYSLALLINIAGLLWACGIAMRFRSIQAGPLMQMPVFIVLFFAPVYVPLSLLEGWIEVNAKMNPLTYVLEAERSMLAGVEIHVALAFGIAAVLVGGFSFWALRGLRSAEAAG